MTFFTNRGTFDFSINVNTYNYSFAQQTSNTDTFVQNLFISSAQHTLLLELWAISISKHRCTFSHFLHCSRFLFTAGRLPICIAAAAVAISIEHNSEMYFNDIQICMYQTFSITIIDVCREHKNRYIFYSKYHLMVDQFAITNSLLFIFSVPSVLMFHPLPQTAKCRRQHPKTRTKSQLQTQLALAAAATLTILQPLILTNLAPRYLEIPNQPFHRPFLQSLKYLPIVN